MPSDNGLLPRDASLASTNTRPDYCALRRFWGQALRRVRIGLRRLPICLPYPESIQNCDAFLDQQHSTEAHAETRYALRPWLRRPPMHRRDFDGQHNCATRIRPRAARAQQDFPSASVECDWIEGAESRWMPQGSRTRPSELFGPTKDQRPAKPT